MTKLLIVEDDHEFRGTLADTLKEQGYEVEEAQDGMAAIDGLKTDTFDLVISDIMMPRATGIDLLKWAKENKNTTPFILITGFSEIFELKEAISLGALAFIPKPFKREELLSAIETALSGKAVPAPEVNLDDNYCKISIEDFVSGTMINIDIYVRLTASKYVMIAHSGQDITSVQIQNYKKKGLNFLHVTKEDFKKYVGMSSTLSKAISKSSGITKERKLNFLRHTSEVLAQHFFSDEVNSESFSHAKNIVETTVSLLSENPDTFKLLESLSQSSDITYAHSVGVSFHAALLAKKLKWLSPLTLFKVSMAGLLHDIGKKEISPEILNKPRHELKASELAILETHTTKGMEILNEMRDIPSDVIQVALQHHENSIGTGYPYRLKPSKTHPLARVVAVADEFCYLTLPSFSGNGLSPKEALQRLVTFQAEKLDAEALSALFVIYGLAPPVDVIEKSRKLQSQKRTA